RTSPTTAQHVWQDLHGRIDLILDGGATTIGVESTVLDLSTSPPRILRPGGVTREMLETIIGEVHVFHQRRAAEPGLPSPGLLEKHYAPHAEMVLLSGPQASAGLRNLLAERQAAGQKVGVLATDDEAADLEAQGAIVYRLGNDLTTIARNIYAGMRWLDAQQVDVILCRDFEPQGLGLAIHDRLTRAATRTIVCS
ncbi:MAG: Sua5/YciO/YrdC/YwlC family protein, partial [Anaerolineales bacterium]|nr:Sua5/YciO/YrdC/YwlC family protein [Anaerolineales bacterium]